MWDRDEMRREGACEVGGKWDATCEASRQPSVFMLTRRAAVFAAMRPTLRFNPITRVSKGFVPKTKDPRWHMHRNY